MWVNGWKFDVADENWKWIDGEWRPPSISASVYEMSEISLVRLCISANGACACNFNNSYSCVCGEPCDIWQGLVSVYWANALSISCITSNRTEPKEENQKTHQIKMSEYMKIVCLFFSLSRLLPTSVTVCECLCGEGLCLSIFVQKKEKKKK